MKVLIIILLVILACSCEKTSNNPKYDPPADHTLSQDGAMHKTGLEQPANNCATCHGADLQGGTSGVSCFECHDNEWDSD